MSNKIIGDMNKTNGHRPECRCDACTTIYLFYRTGHFYPIGCWNDDDARANAECNPGTTKVENATTGKIVWPKK